MCMVAGRGPIETIEVVESFGIAPRASRRSRLHDTAARGAAANASSGRVRAQLLQERGQERLEVRVPLHPRKHQKALSLFPQKPNLARTRQLPVPHVALKFHDDLIEHGPFLLACLPQYTSPHHRAWQSLRLMLDATIRY